MPRSHDYRQGYEDATKVLRMQIQRLTDEKLVWARQYAVIHQEKTTLQAEFDAYVETHP